MALLQWTDSKGGIQSVLYSPMQDLDPLLVVYMGIIPLQRALGEAKAAIVHRMSLTTRMHGKYHA